mmetsp:Transcript_4471/g.7200  ORF Transcript_4471/g.7200 Transcript_4471/m.7200 type:complete len:124 (+) Transcript_4471:2707-3078(+)
MTYLGESVQTCCYHISNPDDVHHGPAHCSLHDEYFYNEPIDGLISSLLDSKNDLDPINYITGSMLFNAASIDYDQSAHERDIPTINKNLSLEIPAVSAGSLVLSQNTGVGPNLTSMVFVCLMK